MDENLRCFSDYLATLRSLPFFASVQKHNKMYLKKVCEGNI